MRNRAKGMVQQEEGMPKEQEEGKRALEEVYTGIQKTHLSTTRI